MVSRLVRAAADWAALMVPVALAYWAGTRHDLVAAFILGACLLGLYVLLACGWLPAEGDERRGA